MQAVSGKPGGRRRDTDGTDGGDEWDSMGKAEGPSGKRMGLEWERNGTALRGVCARLGKR